MLNLLDETSFVNKQVIKVGELYNRIIGNLKSDCYLQDLLVEGEISNLYPRYLATYNDLKGKYLYFDLKGEENRDNFNRVSIPLIHCAMWQTSSLKKDNYLPKEGDKVIVKGSVTAYKDRGQLQLTITTIKPTGIGLLFLKLEELKNKLSKEGLFDPKHKKPFPLYPFNIALLAGDKTAASADVFKTLGKRWPLADITFYPVPVQGKGAVKTICDTLLKIDKLNYDAIILARGGGSFEDLFYFNDEALVRVIYNLNTFIITGIGHEVDFTLAEAAADYRAITPTDAAEKISPNYLDVIDLVKNQHYRLNQAILATINNKKLLFNKQLSGLNNFQLKIIKLTNYLQTLNDNLKHNLLQLNDKKANQLKEINTALNNNLNNKLMLNKYYLKELKVKLNNQINKLLLVQQNRLKRNKILLNAYAPNEVMKKGYVLTFQDNKLIKTLKNLNVNKPIKIKYIDGQITAIIKEGNK